MLSKWHDSSCKINFPKFLAMIGRILIGLLLSARFLEPTLKTGVIMADLKEAGKTEGQIVLLNWQHNCSAKKSAFFFQIFTGMSESCTTLLISKFLIAFIIVFLSTWEK